VELRALCNVAPRTPPGPEGSNGTGITPCAAEYPKFLSSSFSFRMSFCLDSGVEAPDILRQGPELKPRPEIGLKSNGARDTRNRKHELPGDCAEVAATNVRRCGRTGTRDGDARKCHSQRPHRACVYFLRRARRGKDHYSADPGQSTELCEGADSDSLQRM